MNELIGHFKKRIGRFGRVRRGLANATLAYSVGVSALGVGIAALILLCGWTENPFVNAALTLVAFFMLARLPVRLLLRWERRRTVMSEAFRAEELAGDLNSRVISALDFMELPAPTPLTETVIDKAHQDLDRPFEQMLDRTTRNRLRVRFVIMLVAFLLLGSTPWFSFARLRNTVLLSAMNLREILFPTRYEIFPGIAPNIYRIGKKVDVGLRFTRFRYPEVTMLSQIDDGEEIRQTVLSVDAAGRAAVELAPTLEREFRVWFTFGKRTTEEMKLVFTSTPLIENMQVELVYPLYTRLVPKESEGIQDRITALAGTRVNMGFVFSKPLEAAEITFDDNSRMPLDVVGRFASVSFVHSQERRATLQVKDIHGFAMDAPHTVEFGVTADKPPRLIVPKEFRLDMPQTLAVFSGFSPWARVEDDFGAAKCLVKWRKATVEEPNRVKVQGEPVERVFIPPRPKAVAAFENIFREQAQTATPGDLFTFQVQAFDNRAPKPQSTVSSMFSIFIKGQGLEDGTAGGGVDVTGGAWGAFGGGGAQRIYRKKEGGRTIGMPTKLDTAESYRNNEKSERNTQTRGEVRGALGGHYGRATSGAGE